MAKGRKKPPQTRSTTPERHAYELENELYGSLEEVQGELWPPHLSTGNRPTKQQD